MGIIGGSGNNVSDNYTIFSSLLWLFNLTFILPFESQALINLHFKCLFFKAVTFLGSQM